MRCGWIGLLVLALAACGGGDDGGGGGGSDALPPPPLTGRVVKGPFTSGTVEALAVNANGTLGTQIGSASIRADSTYSINRGSHSGPLVVRASGGAYLDEATGTTTQTADLHAATSLVMVPSLVVTPLTGIAWARAQRRISLGGNVALSIARSNTETGNWFGIPDLISTAPADLAGGPVAVVDAAAEYGAILAGISQLALSLTVASDQLSVALALDAADGALDGMDGATPVPLGAGNLSPTAAQADLANAITAFLASAANNSGLTAADFAALIARLNSRPDQLLFPLDITVTPANVTVAQGWLIQYSALAGMSDNTQQNVTGTATWNSTNGAVAGMSATGAADALSAGNTTIQATLQGVTGDTSLTVGNYTLSSVAVTPASPTIIVNSTQQFTATATHSDASTADITALVDWSSTNAMVLGVSVTGLGQGNARGTANAIAAATGTGVFGQTTVSVEYSYATHIQPIFNANCLNCHGVSGGLSLHDYTSLMAGGVSGAVVTAGNSAGSIIVQRIEGTIQPQMPSGAPPLSAQQIQRIKDWIDDGAKNN